MALKDNLSGEIKEIMKYAWREEVAKAPPDPQDLLLNKNHAKHLEEATVLYADIDQSTSMVDNFTWWFSAEIYKAFLRCAAAIIKSEGGSITAYDGDRVMAVFVGGAKNTSAVRSALKIHWAVLNIVQPAIKNQYPNTSFILKHIVGIDTSHLRAARVGVHGDNDLVWVGRAANHAAKLCALQSHQTWITKAIYDNVHESAKFTNGVAMWDERSWTQMGGATIYGSTWWWRID